MSSISLKFRSVKLIVSRTTTFISIIWVLSSANILYSQPLQSEVVHPSWSYNKTIYEVNIRQYTKSGTFKDFEKHLPELKRMGVGILWLTSMEYGFFEKPAAGKIDLGPEML